LTKHVPFTMLQGSKAHGLKVCVGKSPQDPHPQQEGWCYLELTLNHRMKYGRNQLLFQSQDCFFSIRISHWFSAGTSWAILCGITLTERGLISQLSSQGKDC